MKYTRRSAIRTAVASALAIGRTGHGLLAFDEPAGRVRTVDADIVDSSKRAALSIAFEGQTVAEISRWQELFRKQLVQLMGTSQPPPRWESTEETRTKFDDHIRHELVLSAPGVPSVPLYLLVPTAATARTPRPAVLCVHGHGPFGHHAIVGRTDFDGIEQDIAKHHYDYGLQFVRRGYVVAAPCLIPFGRRLKRSLYGSADPCAVNFVRMQALGQLPMTANARDLRWTLDFLQTRPEVNPNQLGCAGLSYGGRMAMLVSAIDERIKVTAASGVLNLLQERITRPFSCGSQIIPGLLQYGDFSEIGSLIAPRPCVWETGSRDPLIVPKWAEVFRRRLARAYAAYNASEQLHFDRFEGGHRWNGDVAYPLFEKTLQS